MHVVEFDAVIDTSLDAPCEEDKMITHFKIKFFLHRIIQNRSHHPPTKPNPFLRILFSTCARFNTWRFQLPPQIHSCAIRVANDHQLKFLCGSLTKYAKFISSLP